jgi:hypothetical protein
METICRYFDVSIQKDEMPFQRCFEPLLRETEKEKVSSFRSENGRRLSPGTGIVPEASIRSLTEKSFISLHPEDSIFFDEFSAVHGLY